MIWRVFGRGMQWYAIPAGDAPLRTRSESEIGTVTARTEAEAISKVWTRLCDAVCPAGEDR